MPKCRKSTKGDLNRLVDEIIHPYIKQFPWLIFADGLLHALVEQDPQTSLRKFIRYNTKLPLRRLKRKPK